MSRDTAKRRSPFEVSMEKGKNWGDGWSIAWACSCHSSMPLNTAHTPTTITHTHTDHNSKLWPREALIDVLLKQNIELRHEQDLSHEHLSKICTRYFADRPLPPLPPPRPRDRKWASIEHAAVITIQRAWIQHAACKRQRRMLARQASDRTCLEGGILPPPGAFNSGDGPCTCRLHHHERAEPCIRG